MCLDGVDVENVCVFVVGVMYSIHSDDVHEFLELPADEEIDAVFRAHRAHNLRKPPWGCSDWVE